MEKESKRKLFTEKAEISLMGSNIIRIQVNENADISERDILEINEAKNRLAGDQKYFVIFITPRAGKISKEARKISASPIVYKNAIAKSIVAPNLPMTMIGNFFINFNRPPAPTRVFRTEEEATKWLKKMRELEPVEV